MIILNLNDTLLIIKFRIYSSIFLVFNLFMFQSFSVLGTLDVVLVAICIKNSILILNIIISILTVDLEQF